jgi:hypothetical protein
MLVLRSPDVTKASPEHRAELGAMGVFSKGQKHRARRSFAAGYVLDKIKAALTNLQVFTSTGLPVHAF